MFRFLINWSFLKTACGCQYLMNIDHFGDDKIDNYRIWIYMDNIYTGKFVIDNVCVSFGNKVFRQIIGIQVDTNCASFVVDIVIRV